VCGVWVCGVCAVCVVVCVCLCVCVCVCVLCRVCVVCVCGPPRGCAGLPKWQS